MEHKTSSYNFYLLSFSTSVVLVIFGLLLLLLQLSTWVTLLALIIFTIGLIQVIVDIGWLSIIKINANLSSWREAYPIVAKQRSQKIFLAPFVIDVSFVILSILLFVTFGLNV